MTKCKKTQNEYQQLQNIYKVKQNDCDLAFFFFFLHILVWRSSSSGVGWVALVS